LCIDFTKLRRPTRKGQNVQPGKNALVGEESGDKEFMATLAKGLTVLALFGRDRPSMTLSQVAAEAELSRATARRILRTLSVLGYVEQDGRQFCLAPAVLNIGYAYLSTQSWIERAQPMMKALSERFQETCSAAVLQGAEVVYVADVPARRIVVANASLGSRLPAFHTSLGRSQLGTLPEAEIWRLLKSLAIKAYTPATITDRQALFDRVRGDFAQGFSLVDEELEQGLRSIAVPVVSRNGQTVAAIALSSHASRASRSEMEDSFLPALRGAAEHIAISVP
jgi:IclR family transcriptional regulator, pca regulon regulatory protein